jgi:hypothetical protein
VLVRRMAQRSACICWHRNGEFGPAVESWLSAAQLLVVKQFLWAGRSLQIESAAAFVEGDGRGIGHRELNKRPSVNFRSSGGPLQGWSAAQGFAAPIHRKCPGDNACHAEFFESSLRPLSDTTRRCEWTSAEQLTLAKKSPPKRDVLRLHPLAGWPGC